MKHITVNITAPDDYPRGLVEDSIEEILTEIVNEGVDLKWTFSKVEPSASKRMVAQLLHKVEHPPTDNVIALGTLIGQWLESVKDPDTEIDSGGGCGGYDLVTELDGKRIEVHIEEITDTPGGNIGEVITHLRNSGWVEDPDGKWFHREHPERTFDSWATLANFAISQISEDL